MGGGSQDFHKEFTEIAFLKDKKRISQQQLFTLLIETIKKERSAFNIYYMYLLNFTIQNVFPKPQV